MSPGNAPSPPPVGIYKKSDLDRSEPSFRAGVVRQFLMTREVRELIAALIPEVLTVWADRSLFKNVISRMVGKSLQHSFAGPDILGNAKDLQQLFQDPAMIESLAARLPEVFHGLTEAAANALKTIESLPAEEKQAILKDMVSGIAGGGSGDMITRAARILNDIHQSDPEFFARTLEPGFAKWVESVDFGEIREAMENSGTDIRAIVQMANHIIWQYPAKVVVGLSMLPLLLNRILEALDISLEKLNDLPPDLLTDVICGFIRDLEAPAIAGLANELAEMARKIHTGSALLGDAENPQIYKTLSGKLDEIMALTDPAALWKSRIMVSELKDQLNQAFFDATARKDEFIQAEMEKKPVLANIRMRAVNRRLAFLDTLDDETVTGSLARAVDAYDIQETAELINNILRLLNRLYDTRPEAAAGFIRQFTDAIDLDELSDAARNLLEDSQAELKPAARAVVPGLVSWVCEILKPEDDEFESEAAQAREALANLFTLMEA
mgnify:CR=1 FL=1